MGQQIKIEIKELAFEKAKYLHMYIQSLDIIFNTIKTHFHESKFTIDTSFITNKTPYETFSYNTVSEEFKSFLDLEKPINTIDAFDISHFQSRHIVGSCIRFTLGKPEKNKFRRFKIKNIIQQNDYAALQEIVLKRYKDGDFPDLILIDGGKGQRNAITKIIKTIKIECISISKKEEILYSTKFQNGTPIDIQTNSGKLLIELRDYAHHFAISYHRLKRKKELS